MVGRVGKFKLADVVLVFSSLTVGMLLTEAVLWKFFPVSLSGLRNYPLFQKVAGNKPLVWVTANEDGIRSNSIIEKNKPPRTVRILAVGGSTTIQPTQNTEDLWTSVLQRLLADRFQIRAWKIEVGSMGRAGGLVHEKLFWMEKIQEYKPDIILTLEGINNLAWVGGPGYHYEREPRLEELKRAHNAQNEELTGGWKGALRQRSQIYRRVVLFRKSLAMKEQVANGKLYDWVGKQLEAQRSRYQSLPEVAVPNRHPDPFTEFSDGMDMWLTRLQNSGIPTVVIEQPVLWARDLGEKEKKALWFVVSTPEGPVRPTLSWLEDEMARYNHEQARLAKLHGAKFIDLEASVPNTLEYFSDDCHFTDRGNVAVAELIEPTIAELVERVIESKGGSPSGVVGFRK